MLNNVVLMGRLTADPTMRHTYTNNVPVASFSIAVDRRFIQGREKEVDFFNVVAWQTTAEFACNHFTKGQPIVVQGRLQQRTWTDEATGTKRYAVEVVAETLHFAGFKRENEHSEPAFNEEFNPYAEDAA